jgi:hypothetical protein
MFGAPPQKALEGKQTRDEDREALNALFASVVTFAVFVGIIRTGMGYTLVLKIHLMHRKIKFVFKSNLYCKKFS